MGDYIYIHFSPAYKNEPLRQAYRQSVVNNIARSVGAGVGTADVEGVPGTGYERGNYYGYGYPAGYGYGYGYPGAYPAGYVAGYPYVA